MEQSNISIYTWLYSQFDSILTGYIAQTSAAIVTAISPTAYVMLGIYFVLWGFSMVRGLIDEPITDGLFRMLKIALIMGFALNVGRYQTDVVAFFMDTPTALGQVLALNGSATGDNSTFAAIDQLVNRTVDVARVAWNEAGVLSGNFGMYIVAFIVLTCGLGFASVAGITILIGKIAMVLLLAIGPLFIVMVMFKTTQRFFDAWLSQVINYLFLLILVLAVSTMFMSMMEIVVANAGEKLMSKAMMEGLASLTIVTLACGVLIFQVGSIASALAGGVALATTSGARRLAGDGLGMARTAGNLGKAGAVVAGKATLGASTVAMAAAKTAGGLFRASNSIRRG